MKKKYVKIFLIILAVFIGINFFIYSYTVLKDNSLSKKEISISDEQYEVIRNILYSVETGNGVYGEKEYENFTEALNISKNEKSITLGAGAFYGDNAKKLLIRIKEKYPGIFEYYDDCSLEEDLKLETWDEYAIEKNSKKGLAIINIIGTKEGIIIQDEMMNEMIFSYLKEAKYLDEIGVDGIIAADPGIIEILKEYAPNTEVHISTQANVTSLHACNFWYKNGANRVILARELSKDEIKHITDNKPNGLDIEMFVHGAICYSYSGRCYMSDYMANRSANHGDCAQPCRWAYNIYAEEVNNPGQLMPVEYDERGTYIFSSKDMCLIKELPEIIDMGIDSLKIEGRLKTEYYVASIVNVYRNAIDDYQKDPSNYDYTKYLKEIEKIKTRGLTTFYFNDRKNKDIQEYSGKQYNEQYQFGGKVVDYDGEKAIIEIRNRLQLGDTLEIIIPGQIAPHEFTITKLWDITADMFLPIK